MPEQGGGVSLNRSEQMVFDYLLSHADEGQHWQQKVRGLAASAEDPHAVAAQLSLELWRYFEERSAVAAPFRDLARREGVQRTSMKNLAELLLRKWTPPRPPKKTEGTFPPAG